MPGMSCVLRKIFQASQIHDEISPHLSEWLVSNSQEITSVSEDVEIRELLYTAINGYSHSGK